MVINIDPILHLGTVEVRWITLIFILSLIIIIAMVVLEARRAGIYIVARDVIGLILSFIIGSLVGGSLFYILDNWQYFATNPEQIISVQFIVLYGVIIGALVGMWLYARIRKLFSWQGADSIAPGAMLGIAVYRIGCIINGCCYGVASDLPWAVAYIHPDTMAPYGKLLHPTQIYHFALSLAVFAVLWTLRKKLKTKGVLFFLWLVLFALSDEMVRPFRAEHAFLFGLQQAQLLGILMLAVTLSWLIIRMCSSRAVA